MELVPGGAMPPFYGGRGQFGRTGVSGDSYSPPLYRPPSTWMEVQMNP
jgi:hypothetical protein